MLPRVMTNKPTHLLLRVSSSIVISYIPTHVQQSSYSFILVPCPRPASQRPRCICRLCCCRRRRCGSPSSFYLIVECTEGLILVFFLFPCCPASHCPRCIRRICCCHCRRRRRRSPSSFYLIVECSSSSSAFTSTSFIISAFFLRLCLLLLRLHLRLLYRHRLHLQQDLTRPNPT